MIERKQSGGFSLVVVLMAVVLCAAMVVLLLSRGATSLQSASAYKHAGQLKALADMAVNRAQAQIKDATTFRQTTDTPLNERCVWASQPGAIRVYTPDGGLAGLYKLYSSDAMQTDNPDLSGDVPEQWHERKAEFTDLNEPVHDGARWHYPIVNPGAAATVPDAKGLTEGFQILPSAPLDPAPGANPVPMPARWIYVLQDGTLCQLGDSRIDLRDNPIIGRIAFWTDDETSKVNLNTASPATASAYWDIPRATTSAERNRFSWSQPAQNEYQRYPGHPAMVSLRPLLGSLGGLSASAYFDYSPQYRWGGSEEGAKRIDNAERISLLTNKQDRAYASVDEILFASKPSGERAQPAPEQVEALRFFLTTSSRAPELNLFGQPRMSIWPIYGNPDKADPGDTRRTPFDRLIAFNSTIDEKPYYFTREEPLSPTHDFEAIPRNRALYAYLQKLTSEKTPGFGGSTFLAKYGADRDAILTEIFDYIRIVNLNETYRGRSANFQSYTPDWKMERFDDATTAINTGGDYPPDNKIRGAGLVAPIQIGDTRGMGRFPVIAEVGLLFVKHAQKKADPAAKPPIPEAPDPENLEQLEVMLVIDTITPAFGYMPWCGKDLVFELVSSNLKFGVGDREIAMFPASAPIESVPIYYPPFLMGTHSPGGYDGPGYVAGRGGHWVAGAGTDYIQEIYRFFSPPLDLQSDDANFYIQGGKLKMNIRVEGAIVQSYTFDFPDAANLPMPIRSSLDFSSYTAAIGRNWWAHRFAGAANYGPLDGDVLHSIQLKHGDARLVAGLKDVPEDIYAPHRDYGKPVRFAHGMFMTRNGQASTWNGGSNGSYVDLPLFSEPHTDPGEQRSNRLRTSRPKIPSTISSLRDKGWSGDFDNGWSIFRFFEDFCG